MIHIRTCCDGKLISKKNIQNELVLTGIIYDLYFLCISQLFIYYKIKTFRKVTILSQVDILYSILIYTEIITDHVELFYIQYTLQSSADLQTN